MAISKVTSGGIADGTLSVEDIADDAVTAAKLANSINTDIATGVTGNTTANAALPKAGGAMTGTITGFTSTGIDDNADATAITINTSEQVGIGTTAPDHKLTVASGSLKLAEGNSRLVFGTVGGTDRRALEGNTAGTMLQIGEGYSKTRLYGSVGIGTSAPLAQLHLTGSGTFNHTPGQNTTSDFIITSSEMGDNNAHSIMQLVSVRQSLSTGSGSTGYLGFSTIDDSNGQGIRDAGRIAIVNENGASRNSATALSFWTNAGGADTTAATEKLRISSAGAVTMPYQPAFNAHLSSHQDAVGTIIFNGTPRVNIGNNYSNSTGKFTAPIAGTYHFTFQGLGQSVTTANDYIMYVNSTAYTRIRTPTSTGHESFYMSGIVTLSVNDYVLIHQSTSSTNYVYGDTSWKWTHFSGHLIG